MTQAQSLWSQISLGRWGAFLFSSIYPTSQYHPCFSSLPRLRKLRSLVWGCELNSANRLNESLSKIGLEGPRETHRPLAIFMQPCSSLWISYHWVIYWHLTMKKIANNSPRLSKQVYSCNNVCSVVFGAEWPDQVLCNGFVHQSGPQAENVKFRLDIIT